MKLEKKARDDWNARVWYTPTLFFERYARVVSFLRLLSYANSVDVIDVILVPKIDRRFYVV